MTAPSWQLISSSSLNLYYQGCPMTVPSLAIDLFIIVTSVLSRWSNDCANLVIYLFIIVTSSLSRSSNDFAFPGNWSLHHRYIFTIKIVQWLRLPGNWSLHLFIIVTSSLLRSSNDCAFPDGYWSLLDCYILVIKIVEWLCLSWQLIFSTSLSPHYQDRTMTVPFLAIGIILILKSTLSRSSNDCAFPRNWSIHHR